MIKGPFGKELETWVQRHVYENSAELWPHLDRMHNDFVPVVQSVPVQNPFSKPATSLAPPMPRVFSGADADKLYDAASFCMAKFGLTLNAHLTIVWRGLGITDHERAARILSKFNKEAASWLGVGAPAMDRQRITKRSLFGSSPHVYVYAHENTTHQGFHTHQLMYVPRDKAQAFELWAEACLSRLSGRRRAEIYAVHLTPRTKKRGFLPPVVSDDADAAVNMWRSVKYIMKSLPDAWVWTFADRPPLKYRDVYKPWGYKPSLPIYARKIAGVSENIGAAAQQAAGFASKVARQDFDQLYDGSELDDYRRRVADEKHEAEMLDVLVRLKI